jgi:hypothetical protein
MLFLRIGVCAGGNLSVARANPNQEKADCLFASPRGRLPTPANACALVTMEAGCSYGIEKNIEKPVK